VSTGEGHPKLGSSPTDQRRRCGCFGVRGVTVPSCFVTVTPTFSTG
jgi:hypothetical protein